MPTLKNMKGPIPLFSWSFFLSLRTRPLYGPLGPYETPSEWLWLWLSPAVSRLSLPLSIHTRIRIHIVTIIVYYISWYWQNRHRPDFRLKRLLVSVTQSWHFTDTSPRTGLYHWCQSLLFLLLLFPSKKLTKIWYTKRSMVQILFLKENPGPWADTQPTNPSCMIGKQHAP